VAPATPASAAAAAASVVSPSLAARRASYASIPNKSGHPEDILAGRLRFPQPYLHDYVAEPLPVEESSTDTPFLTELMMYLSVALVLYAVVHLYTNGGAGTQYEYLFGPATRVTSFASGLLTAFLDFLRYLLRVECTAPPA